MGPDFVDAILEPVVAVLGPHRRVYWPFVGGSILLAIFVWARLSRGRTSLLSYLLPKKVFLHPSSRFDARWFLVRGIVHAILAWPLRISVVTMAVTISHHLRERVGMPPWSSPKDRAAVIASFSIALFLVDDFTRFALHRLMHRSATLWELHKVHHSAEVLTPLTLYRVHPIESVLNNLRGLFAIGLVTGVFTWALPGRLTTWSILGVDAIGFLWTSLGANLRHSHVWLTWTKPLEHVVLSPAQHQVHHGREEADWDRNFGSALAIWDWIFGSLRIASGSKPVRVGLKEGVNHELRVMSALIDPVVAACKAALRRR